MNAARRLEFPSWRDGMLALQGTQSMNIQFVLHYCHAAGFFL